MSEKKKYYLNPGQRFIHTIDPNSLTLVASRRFGKSDGVAGPRTIRRIQQMPRSVGFIYADTFVQALSRTLAGTLAAIERMGYVEDRHFFIGRKAPPHMKFPVPIIAPRDWRHVIHWYNGSIIHLLSQDVKMTANSLTTDWGMVDEARSTNKEKFTQEVIPTLSGTPGKFENCHYKKGVDIITDMPFGKQGSWILDNKAKMDLELLESIKGTIYELNRLKAEAGSNPSHWYQSEIARNTTYLNQMRKHLHLYIEFDTIENLEVVRPEYIAEQKRILPPITFAVSIMNKRRIKNTSGFYVNLDESLHYYASYNNTYIDNIRSSHGTIDLKKIKNTTCLHDGDIDPNQPLFIAFDFNSAINWVVTGQPIEYEMRTLSSKYTKHERKLRALLEDWHNYYQYHITREVVVYYDSTATKSAYADEQAESFIDIIFNTLSLKRWAVTLIYIGNPMDHQMKHQYIDDALTGRKGLFPRFNRNNNEHLLPALEMAGVRIGKTGFEKDKSGEKLAETDDNLLEFRTDGTDAWDTLFIGLNFFPYTSPGMAATTYYGS